MNIRPPDSSVIRDSTADCDIGDFVPAAQAPQWSDKRVHQEFFPPGHAMEAPPWLFAPVFEGTALSGWKRID